MFGGLLLWILLSDGGKPDCGMGSSRKDLKFLFERLADEQIENATDTKWKDMHKKRNVPDSDQK